MSQYYHHVRSDIRKLLPPEARRILELGAGAGRTGRWLKRFYTDAEVVAIEINPELEPELKENVDRAVIGSVDHHLDTLGKFDLVLALDVLEHLPDPQKTLSRVRDALLPGGSVIISVPNVAHYSVSLPLLLRRRFRYEEAGILDRTHLRFFVEDTAVELIRNAGLTFEAGLLSGPEGRKAGALDRLTFGLFRHHLTKQYLMRGRLDAAARSAKAPTWEII